MALTASPAQHEREQQLIEAARHNPGAFEVLYAHNVDAIYAYALHRVGDVSVAEDVVAETFHRALENLDRFEWRGVPFSAWLYRIASNAIAARYRREPTLGLDDVGELYDQGIGPEQALLVGERGLELRAAVARLPFDQKQVVILRYGQDLRNKEIAQIMGRSEGAIKQLLHRALNGLHRRLVTAGSER